MGKGSEGREVGRGREGKWEGEGKEGEGKEGEWEGKGSGKGRKGREGKGREGEEKPPRILPYERFSRVCLYLKVGEKMSLREKAG